VGEPEGWTSGGQVFAQLAEQTEDALSFERKYRVKPWASTRTVRVPPSTVACPLRSV
jgi:hypothetical protein